MLDPEKPISRKVIFRSHDYAQCVRVKQLCENDPKKHSTSYITIEKPNDKYQAWKVVRLRNLSGTQVNTLRERTERHLVTPPVWYRTAELIQRWGEWRVTARREDRRRELRLQRRIELGYGPAHGERGLGANDYHMTYTWARDQERREHEQQQQETP